MHSAHLLHKFTKLIHFKRRWQVKNYILKNNRQLNQHPVLHFALCSISLLSVLHSSWTVKIDAELPLLFTVSQFCFMAVIHSPRLKCFGCKHSRGMLESKHKSVFTDFYLFVFISWKMFLVILCILKLLPNKTRVFACVLWCLTKIRKIMLYPKDAQNYLYWSWMQVPLHLENLAPHGYFSLRVGLVRPWSCKGISNPIEANGTL